MKKIYYRMTFTNISGMNLSNGENNNSDSDIYRNSLGKPSIPSSSLAGVYRSLFADNKKDEYFGNLDQFDSKIIVYDANIEGEYGISIRDSVALDEYKVTKEGAKMDFEVLNPGAKFVTYIEVEDKEISEHIINYWHTNNLSFGGKTMRGLGECQLLDVKYAEFELPCDDWLDFDMYENKGWSNYEYKEFDNDLDVLKLELKQVGGISIRKYTTKVKSSDVAEPDYEQLNYYINGEKRPFIPGTTWSGAFRHRMEKLIPYEMNIYFGSVNSKSNIRFNDTEITNFKEKIFSRNAVDRFTSGTKDGALYTERFVYGGKVNLEISFKKGSETFKKALAATITDLHYGYLAIGGLTSIGRGLFVVSKINDKEVNNKTNIYELLLKEMGAM